MDKLQNNTGKDRGLFDDLCQIIEQTKQTVAVSVNQGIALMYCGTSNIE